MFRLALLALLIAATAHAAQPLPPQLNALQSELTRARAQLNALDAKVNTAQSSHKQAIAALNHHTVTILRLRQWPQPLLVAQGLATFTDKPLATSLPGILHASQTATATRLASARRNLDDYLTLRQEAQDQWQTLDLLARQLAAQQNRLSRQQKRALAAAALEADQLATLLESRLSQPEPTRKTVPSQTSAARAPNLHPVAGPAVAAPTGQGVHFMAPPNAPVVATLPGKVMYSGPFRTMGGLVITQSGNNLYAVYAGLGTLEVGVGQDIAPGTRLGAMPADATAGLYYEVRRNGRPIALQP